MSEKTREVRLGLRNVGWKCVLKRAGETEGMAVDDTMIAAAQPRTGTGHGGYSSFENVKKKRCCVGRVVPCVESRGRVGCGTWGQGGESVTAPPPDLPFAEP
jgi:hypothetical protein